MSCRVHQCTSNSWTFLEVNVSIICACLPMMKSPLTKFVPWMGDKYSPRPVRGADFERSVRFQKHTFAKQSSSAGQRQRRGVYPPGTWLREEDYNITYEEASRISEPGVINGRSESTRYDKHGWQPGFDDASWVPACGDLGSTPDVVGTSPQAPQ